jgi:hypothetical protein
MHVRDRVSNPVNIMRALCKSIISLTLCLLFLAGTQHLTANIVTAATLASIIHQPSTPHARIRFV